MCWQVAVFPGPSGDDSASKLIRVLGSIQFLVAVGRSLWTVGWESASTSGGPLHSLARGPFLHLQKPLLTRSVPLTTPSASPHILLSSSFTGLGLFCFPPPLQGPISLHWVCLHNPDTLISNLNSPHAEIRFDSPGMEVLGRHL